MCRYIIVHEIPSLIYVILDEMNIYEGYISLKESIILKGSVVYCGGKLNITRHLPSHRFYGKHRVFSRQARVRRRRLVCRFRKIVQSGYYPEGSAWHLRS